MNTGIRYHQRSSNFINKAATTGSAVAAISTDTWASAAWVRGYKAVSGTAAPTDNSASMWIGFAESGSTTPNLVQEVGVGETVALLIPEGTCRNLKELYILGTTGDYAHIEYFKSYKE